MADVNQARSHLTRVRRGRPLGHRPPARRRQGVQLGGRPLALATAGAARHRARGRAAAAVGPGPVLGRGPGRQHRRRRHRPGPRRVGVLAQQRIRSGWWNCAKLAALAGQADAALGRIDTGPSDALVAPLGLEAQHLRARPRRRALPTAARRRGGGTMATILKGPADLSPPHGQQRRDAGRLGQLPRGRRARRPATATWPAVQPQPDRQHPRAAGQGDRHRRPRGPVGMAEAGPGLAEPRVHPPVRRQRPSGRADVAGRDGPARRRRDRRRRRGAAPDPAGDRARDLARRHRRERRQRGAAPDPRPVRGPRRPAHRRSGPGRRGAGGPARVPGQGGARRPGERIARPEVAGDGHDGGDPGPAPADVVGSSPRPRRTGCRPGWRASWRRTR